MFFCVFCVLCCLLFSFMCRSNMASFLQVCLDGQVTFKICCHLRASETLIYFCSSSLVHWGLCLLWFESDWVVYDSIKISFAPFWINFTLLSKLERLSKRQTQNIWITPVTVICHKFMIFNRMWYMCQSTTLFHWWSEVKCICIYPTIGIWI